MKKITIYIFLILFLLFINIKPIKAISNLSCNYEWKGEKTNVIITADYQNNIVNTVNIEIFGVKTKVYDKNISSLFLYQVKPNDWWIDMNFQSTYLYNQGKCPSLHIGWTKSEKSGLIYLSGNTESGETEYEALELTSGQSDGTEQQKEFSKSYVLVNTYRGSTDDLTLGLNLDGSSYYILNQSEKKSLNETITASLFIYRIVDTNDLIVKSDEDDSVTFADMLYICKDKVDKGYTYLAIVSKSGKSAFTDCVSIDPTKPQYEEWEKPQHTCFSTMIKDVKLCEYGSALKTFQVIGVILLIAKILVPLLLIIMASISLSSAIVAADTSAITKAAKSLGLKIVIGILIFLIPTIVNYVFGLLKTSKAIKGEFAPCLNCLYKPSSCSTKGKKLYVTECKDVNGIVVEEE